MPNLSHSLIARILLLFGGIIMILFAFTTPPFETPDEPQHLDYINYVAKNHRMPNQAIPNERIAGEGNQPPLYYFLASTLVRLIKTDNTVNYHTIPNGESNFFGGPSGAVPVFNHLEKSFFPTPRDQLAFYSLRLISVVAGFLTLLVIWKTGQSVFGDSIYCLVPLAITVCIPQFLFMAGALTNDVVAILFASLTIYFSFRFLQQPNTRPPYLWAALTLGLGLITKQTNVFLIPGVMVALIYCATRVTNKRRFLKTVGFIGVIIILTSGWLFVRNRLLYGDFLGTALFKAQLPNGYHPIPISYFWHDFFPALIISYFAHFGWMTLVFPHKLYLIYGGLLLLTAAGLVGYTLSKDKKDSIVTLSGIYVFLCLIGVMFFNLIDVQPQGRYLFPSQVAITLLATVSVRNLLKNKSIHKQKIILTALFLILGSLPLYALVLSHRFYTNPAYYRPPRVGGSIEQNVL